MKNVEKRKHGGHVSMYEIYVGVNTTLANVSCCLPANHPLKMSFRGKKPRNIPAAWVPFLAYKGKSPSAVENVHCGVALMC